MGTRAAALGLLAWLAGCNLVAGLGDYQRGADATASSGSGGSAPACSLAFSAVQVLIGASQTPRQVTVQGTYVYWMEADVPGQHATVQRLGPVETKAESLAADQNGIDSFAVDANRLYIAFAAGASSDVLGIDSQSLPSGNSQRPWVPSGNYIGARGLIARDFNLYWIAERSAGTDVLELPAGATQPIVLAAAANLKALAAGGDYVYVTDGQQIGELPRGQANAQPVHVASGAIGALAADGTNVYWTETANGLVRGRRGDLSADAFTIAEAQRGPSAIAVDLDAVYWIDANSNAVMAACKQPNAKPVTVAAGQPAVSIAVDPAGVYWVNAAGGANGVGTVARARKL